MGDVLRLRLQSLAAMYDNLSACWVQLNSLYKVRRLGHLACIEVGDAV